LGNNMYYMMNVGGILKQGHDCWIEERFVGHHLKVSLRKYGQGESELQKFKVDMVHCTWSSHGADPPISVMQGSQCVMYKIFPLTSRVGCCVSAGEMPQTEQVSAARSVHLEAAGLVLYHTTAAHHGEDCGHLEFRALTAPHRSRPNKQILLGWCNDESSVINL